MTQGRAPARRLTRLAALALSAAALILTGCATHPADTTPAAEQRSPRVETMAAESAYVYAFALMMTDALLQTAAAQTPPGHFTHQRTLDDDALPPGVRARVDALTSSAFIDLHDGPVVLSLPDAGRRHLWVALHDAWTDIFESLGNRTTGTRAAHYAITPPGWQGPLPAGVKPIASPTMLVWIVARTQVAGMRDEAAARRVQDRYRLTPLEDFGKPAARDADADAGADKAEGIDISLNAARARVSALDANAYFTRFAALLKDNPPHPADSTMVDTLRTLGITPGATFNAATLGAATAQAIETAVATARNNLAVAAKQPPIPQNGWFIPRMVGAYGLDYVQRAIVAWAGAGADLPQDMLIATAAQDTNGMPLDSAHRYVLHFDAGQLPPENASWAVAAVQQPRRIASGPGPRNMLSEADRPRLNRDGSLDILIQRAPPKGLRNNWLPPPVGPFLLRMQLTWPKEAALDATWLPPMVQRVD